MIVGEIVHDIRSSLDHTVYQLIVHATGSAPADDSRTQFPIFLKLGTFDSNRAKMLAGVSKKATVLVKGLQPFSTGENASSPLWHLNQLSNIDKHRTLHTTGGTVQTFNYEFPPIVNPGTVERDYVRETGTFDNNTIMASGRFISADNRPMFGSDQVQMKAGMAFDVVFDQSTPLVEGWSVNGSLMSIADRSRDCIAKIGSDILSLDFVL